MIGWYAMWSASLLVGALILAHWLAKSGMNSGGFTGDWQSPEKLVSGGLNVAGLKPASFLSRYRDHSRLFISCGGVFSSSEYAG